MKKQCHHRPGFRQKEYRDELRSRADGTVSPQETLWFTRALRPSPVAHNYSCHGGGETFEWIKRPEDGLLEGDVHTDGSLMDN